MVPKKGNESRQTFSGSYRKKNISKFPKRQFEPEFDLKNGIPLTYLWETTGQYLNPFFR